MSKAAAYCLLTDRLFPGSIALHKVKWNPRSEVEIISNWKTLQNAWHELGIDKVNRAIFIILINNLVAICSLYAFKF